MATYKYKSNDTWTRGRMESMGRKRKPDSIFDWPVDWGCCTKIRKKQGKQWEAVGRSIFIPSTHWRLPVGKGREERRTHADRGP